MARPKSWNDMRQRKIYFVSFGAFNYMVEKSETFTGVILRIEPNGFGVVKFDKPIGPSANTHGIFSSTLSSSSHRYVIKLHEGSHVSGVAETQSDPQKVAAVKTIEPLL